VFAEFETKLRRERQLEGIAKAKAAGVYKGRPPSIEASRRPIVGHWDSVLEWRSSAGVSGLKLVDVSHWMAIPEIPAP
jgi:hypothetical protein